MITFFALENYKNRSFEILFNTFNAIETSEKIIVKDFLFDLSKDEYYESLRFHQKIILTYGEFGNIKLIDNFFIWKYSTFIARKIDINFFLYEYEVWVDTVKKILYNPYAFEICEIYSYIQKNHKNFIKEAIKLLNNIDNIGNTDNNSKNSSLNISRILQNKIINAIFGGNKELLKEISLNAIKNYKDYYDFLEKVINPVMYEIGFLWQSNKITVAKEHMATAAIDWLHQNLEQEMQILSGEYGDYFEDSNSKKIAIVATIGDELHTLGAKIVTSFLESIDWRAINFNSNLNADQLIGAIYEFKPKIVLISLTLVTNLPEVKEFIHKLRLDKNIFKIFVIIGGQGVLIDNQTIEIEGVDFIARNLQELKDFLYKIQN